MKALVTGVLDSLLSGPLQFARDRAFFEGDIADRAMVRRVIDEHPDIEATIHTATRIVVPESVEHPYEYYRDQQETSDCATHLRRARTVHHRTQRAPRAPARRRTLAGRPWRLRIRHLVTHGELELFDTNARILDRHSTAVPLLRHACRDGSPSPARTIPMTGLPLDSPKGKAWPNCTRSRSSMPRSS